MAKCPKCEKPIPGYKSFTHTKWTGIRCGHCGARSFIRRKDLYLWNLFAGLIGGLFGLLFFFFFLSNYIYSLIVGAIVAYLFYYTIGWNNTKLGDKF